MLMTQRSEDELTSIDSREPIYSNNGIELCVLLDSSYIYLLGTVQAKMYFRS